MSYLISNKFSRCVFYCKVSGKNKLQGKFFTEFKLNLNTS